MTIRCPQCEFIRTVPDNKIPPTAEVATCPRCKHRFRFRTIEKTNKETFVDKNENSTKVSKNPKNSNDIWEAMDDLQTKWKQQGVITSSESIEDSKDNQNKQLNTLISNNELPKETIKTKLNPNQHSFFDANKKDGLNQESLDDESRDKSLEDKGISSKDSSKLTNNSSDCLEEDKLSPNLNETDISTQKEIITTSSMILEKQVVRPFFYHENDITPEEKVESDILLMMESKANLVRDLGTLDEHYSKLEKIRIEEENKTASIPWEYPEILGWIKSLIKTIFITMFSPTQSFNYLSTNGSLTPAYLFLLIIGYIGFTSIAGWTYLFKYLFNLETSFLPLTNITVLLLVAPIILGSWMILVACCFTLFLKVIKNNSSSFVLNTKIICYATSPLILSIIPVLGSIVGSIWFLYIFATACYFKIKLSLFNVFMAVSICAVLTYLTILLYSLV